MYNERIRTCFIAAPFHTDIRPITDALAERGVRVIGFDEPSASNSFNSLQASIFSSISQADLVVGVLTHGDSKSTMFELGVAAGSGKPLLIFVPAKGDVLPSSLDGFQVVRASLQNREAVNFALDQILASPSRPSRPDLSRRPSPSGSKIETSVYRIRLSELLRGNQFHELERLVAQVLRESSAEIVAEAPTSDRRFDLVVWSDDLQSYVGNPFPIEIKAHLRSREDAKRALNQIEKSANAIGSRWSLLLYGEGPSADDRVWLSKPGVLALKIDSLFGQLESKSFPDIVRSLRNRRAHGFNN